MAAGQVDTHRVGLAVMHLRGALVDVCGRTEQKETHQSHTNRQPSLLNIYTKKRKSDMAELHFHRILLLIMSFKRLRGSIKTSSSGRLLLKKWDLKSRGRALGEGSEFPLLCMHIKVFMWYFSAEDVCLLHAKEGRKKARAVFPYPPPLGFHLFSH